MRSPLPLTWLGLSAQLPLQAPFSGDTQIRFERIEQERATQVPMAETKSVEFAFNESPGVFAPKDLVSDNYMTQLRCEADVLCSALYSNAFTSAGFAISSTYRLLRSPRSSSEDRALVSQMTLGTSS